MTHNSTLFAKNLLETTAVSHSEQRAGQIPKVAILVGWLKHVVFLFLTHVAT